MLEVIYNCKLLSVIFAQQRSNYALKQPINFQALLHSWIDLPFQLNQFIINYKLMDWMIYTSDCEVFALASFLLNRKCCPFKFFPFMLCLMKEIPVSSKWNNLKDTSKHLLLETVNCLLFIENNFYLFNYRDIHLKCYSLIFFFIFEKNCAVWVSWENALFHRFESNPFIASKVPFAKWKGKILCEIWFVLFFFFFTCNVIRVDKLSTVLIWWLFSFINCNSTLSIPI